MQKTKHLRVVLCSNRIDNEWLQTAVVFDAGRTVSKSNYLQVLTGIGIDSDEDLTSFPLAICIKNPQTKSVTECTVFFGFVDKSCWRIFCQV